MKKFVFTETGLIQFAEMLERERDSIYYKVGILSSYERIIAMVYPYLKKKKKKKVIKVTGTIKGSDIKLFLDRDCDAKS